MEFGKFELVETANEWNSTHVFVEYELPLEEGGAVIENDDIPILEGLSASDM